MRVPAVLLAMARPEPRLTPPKIVAVERRDERLLPALVPVLERAGWEPRVVDDLAAWASERSSAVVLLSLSGEDDWRHLELLTQRNGAVVMALLPHPRPSLYRRAFMAGASAVASAGDSPAHIARVLHAAMFDYALVPVATLREPRTARAVLSERDKVLLRGLADGLTTEQLADRVGCSERTVYRRLRRVCNSLQVRSRSEAVSVALRLGLLTGPLVSA